MLTIKSIRWTVLKKAINWALGGCVDVNEWASLEDEMAGKPLKFRVNWSCYGDTDPLAAIDFAENITKAGFIAQCMTELGLKIEYSQDLDGFDNLQHAHDVSQSLADEIRTGSAHRCREVVEDFLQGKEFSYDD